MTLEMIETGPKRRDKLIIMMDIVCIAKKETSKTHIMFKANLSFSQLNEYIGYLLDHNLLEAKVSKGRISYKATLKGLEFVEKQHQVICMFSDNGIGSRLRISALKTGFINSKAPLTM